MRHTVLPSLQERWSVCTDIRKRIAIFISKNVFSGWDITRLPVRCWTKPWRWQTTKKTTRWRQIYITVSLNSQFVKVTTVRLWSILKMLRWLEEMKVSGRCLELLFVVFFNLSIFSSFFVYYYSFICLSFCFFVLYFCINLASFCVLIAVIGWKTTGSFRSTYLVSLVTKVIMNFFYFSRVINIYLTHWEHFHFDKHGNYFQIFKNQFFYVSVY